MKRVTLSKTGNTEFLILSVPGSCESKSLERRTIYKSKMAAIEMMLVAFPELEMRSWFSKAKAA